MEAANISQFMLQSGSTQNLSTKGSVTSGVESGQADGKKAVSVQASDPASNDKISIAKSVVVEQIVTQQIEIALQINTSDRSEVKGSSGNPLDDLIIKLSDKIDDDISKNQSGNSDSESYEHHRATVVKDIGVKVEQGFQQATTVLNQIGIMDASAQDQISQARQQVGSTIDQSSAQSSIPARDSAMEVATANGVEGSRELTSAVQLTTRDGDVVTIELSRSQSLSAGAVESESAASVFADRSTSSQLNISVQGDLNKKESESIREVVKRVYKMAEKLFDGKTEAAMEKLSELDINSRQLASMSLSMSSSITYAAVSAYAEVSAIPVDLDGAAPVLDSESNPAQSIDARDVDMGERSASQADPARSVAGTAVSVTREIAVAAAEIEDADVFENPLREISRLFASIADSIGLANPDRGSEQHYSYVKELFENVLEIVQDRDSDDHERDHSDNASVLIQHA